MSARPSTIIRPSFRRFGDWHLDLTPPADPALAHLHLSTGTSSENNHSRK
jgi:hypothetical protein